MNPLPPYFGQCLCGTIQYEVDQFTTQMGHCHCSMCRKFSGAAFATFGEAHAQHFHWLQGQPALKSYIGHNGSTRKFCRHCGSSMTFSPANCDGKIIEIALGTLDSPIKHQPDAHIFTDHKASWFLIEDHLPQFSGARSRNL